MHRVSGRESKAGTADQPKTSFESKRKDAAVKQTKLVACLLQGISSQWGKGENKAGSPSSTIPIHEWLLAQHKAFFSNHHSCAHTVLEN